MAQPFGIFHHQRELGDDVFQVVHHKGRHAAESLKLLGLQQRFGGLHLGQKAGSLAPGRLEQVVHLPVHVHACARAAQNHKTQQFLPQPQRHQQPGLRLRCQPARQHQVVVALGLAAVFGQVHHPAGAVHERHQRRIHRFRLVHLRQVPAGHVAKQAFTRSAQPQGPRRALQHVGQPANHMQTHVLRTGLVRQRLSKLQPLFPVVVAVAKKVFAQQHPHMGPKRARQDQHKQQHQRQKNQRQLQCPAPVAAKVAHVIPHARDEQQIAPDQQQRGRMEHHLARDPDLANPVAVARGGHEHQRHQRGMHQPPNVQRVGVDAVEQHRLRKQVQVVNKRAGQPQANRLGTPQRVFGQVAKQLLDQHQPKHRHQHHGQEHRRQARFG